MADTNDYGPLTALDGADLQLQEGERLALPGPNGAGKTTATGLLPGLIRAGAGGVTLFGQDSQHGAVSAGMPALASCRIMVSCASRASLSKPILKKSDFDFDLPRELIAQAPLAQRSASRLLLLDVAAQRREDRAFRELPEFLRPGDLLVFNDTRVMPARLHGHKSTGGAAEILIERITGEHEATVQLGVSKKPKVGGVIVLADGSHAVVLGRDEDFFQLHFESPEPLEKLLLKLGEMPLPPYIERQPDASDRERYQTVYARELGAVAAPTAGLHFDQELLATLTARGVNFGYITLHVGAGTFQPVREDDVEDHHMHREWLSVGADLIAQMRRTRAAGGRVIAVGTTVVRALESAIRDGELQPFVGETGIFIYPGYRITSIDGLITNFHLPQSTLLMLVSAFAGREYMLDAYRHAVEQRYRFFSYGDAMLILPRVE